MNDISVRIFLPFLCLAAFSGLQDAFAQESGPGHANLPTVMTPQAADMIRYDNSSGDIAHGRANVSIPIISVEDPDFDIGISLGYAMDGFKPLCPDNYVGMGWHLIFGGVITRQVNGIPDEFYDLESYTGFLGAVSANVSGMYAGGTHSLSVKNELVSGKAQSMGLREVFVGEGHMTKAVIPPNGTTELSPDIFRFSFGRHSGMFMIDYDKSVKVISDSGGRYIVDLSGFGRRKDNQDINSVIRITTDDGYVYSFGGKYDTMDYTAVSWLDFYSSGTSADSVVHNYGYERLLNDRPSRRNIPTAFYLSEVKAPDGRKLRIEYDSGVPEQLHLDPTSIVASGGSVRSSYGELLKHYAVSASLTAKSHNCQLNGCDIRYNLSKIALVKSISTEDTEIRFFFSGASNPYFCLDSQKGSYYYMFVKDCGAKLDSVVMRSRGRVTEKSLLSYRTDAGRLLLSKVRNSRYGDYELEYGSSGTFTSSLTIDIDKWGFWSGRGANGGYTQIPAEPETINWNTRMYNRDPDDVNRDPTGKEYYAFMLSGVRLPTGGRIEYEYEPHYYSQYYDQSPLSYIWQLAGTMSRKKLAGGARLKKETYKDGVSSLPQIKYYKYSSDMSRSSGTLMQQGENYLRLNAFPGNSGGGSYVTSPDWSVYLAKPDPVGSYIEYSEVYEYDRLPADEQPDSVFTYARHTLDGPAIEESLYLKVGELGASEQYSTWTIRGESSPQRGLSTSFSIYRSGVLVMSHTFADAVEEIVIEPKSRFGDGTYRIDVHVDPMVFISITARYPRPMELSGPYKVTRFSDPLLIHRPNTFYGAYRYCEDADYLAMFGSFAENFYGIPEGWSRMGNRVVSETFYNASGGVDRRIGYTYSRIDSGTIPYIYSYGKVQGSIIGAYNQIVEVPFFCCLQSGKVQTDYGANGAAVTVTERASYNGNGYLRSVETSDSHGKNFVKGYTYPFDHSGDVYGRMMEMNMLAPVVSETVSADSVQVSALRRSYRLHKEDSLAVVDTLSFIEGTGDAEPRTVYPEYDSYGNPLFIVQDNALKTVYLWSYFGRYVVAKIENAEYADVVAALGNYGPELISRSAEPDMSVIDGLRSALPSSMVSTYTYIPHVGMSSSTGPDGMTVHYGYDSAGRLEMEYIYDENGVKSVLRSYEYNLVNRQED